MRKTSLESVCAWEKRRVCWTRPFSTPGGVHVKRERCHLPLKQVFVFVFAWDVGSAGLVRFQSVILGAFRPRNLPVRLLLRSARFVRANAYKTAYIVDGTRIIAVCDLDANRVEAGKATAFTRRSRAGVGMVCVAMRTTASCLTTKVSTRLLSAHQTTNAHLLPLPQCVPSRTFIYRSRPRSQSLMAATFRTLYKPPVASYRSVVSSARGCSFAMRRSWFVITA